MAKIGHTTDHLPLILANNGLAQIGLAKVGLNRPRQRRRKERIYPELSGDQGCAKLIVLAGETGGLFSEQTQTFIRLLARAKTRSVPEPLRTRARQSWALRFGSLLACAAARALASSLLDRRGQSGPMATFLAMLRFWETSAGACPLVS